MTIRGGRTQKSDRATALAGTARADRPRTEGVKVPTLAYVPEPPNWILTDAAASAEWRRIAPILTAQGLLTELDIQTLANLCSIQSKIMRGWEERGLHAAYKTYASALGLGAAWRSRVVKGEKEQPKNPFDALKQWKPN